LTKFVRSILLIVVVTGLAIYLVIPNTPGFPFLGREIKTYLGLDLVGGIQVLLEADLPETQAIDAGQMDTARRIVDNRVNGLGVTEALVQLAGDRRIVVELPDVDDPEQAVDAIKGTALLEFVDMGQTPLPQGSFLYTDLNLGDTEIPEGEFIWPTLMTGADLVQAYVTSDILGRPAIGFELSARGSQIFSDYTTNNIGSFLAIVLDKEIISAPSVEGPIPSGQGIIEGNFTFEEANSLAIQLRYGALPIPLKVVETRTIGPTLGQDSLQKSLVAGIIGITVVMLFMAIFYRVPGLVANIAILIYGLIVFALFRTIPVTLTLAGVAGLLLSTGSALDANILIFERLKEELRAKKSLLSAVELSFRRAWPSIRDSNIATLITCTILFWFGSAFGATIVKGFALTLMIGVFVSLFTAIFVTRVLLNVIFNMVEPRDYGKWFGI
jgi:preprotein translocase subunit SecD